MSDSMAVPELERVLSAVGELLSAEDSRVAVVVVGGAALALLGFVSRGTFDIDVIARAEESQGGWTLIQAEPIPVALRNAIAAVARDLDLPSDWMNTVVGRQWPQGLPPDLLSDITWRSFGGLSVGLVGRGALVALKLFAAADRGPASVHVQDLIALAPDDAELDEAAGWVRGQDAAPEFAAMVDGVLGHVRRHR